MTTASERLRNRTLGFSLGLFLLAGSVHADTTEDQKKTARNAMAEGRELRDEKNYKDALESFKKAHAIMAVPTTGIEVARTLVLLGQLVEARDVAIEVAKIAPIPKEPAPFQAARDEAKKMAEDLAKRIPTLQIVLEGAEKGSSEVRIDEAPISAAMMKSPIPTNPGKHAITAKRGSDLKSTELDLKEGEAQTVTLDFRPAKVDAPPPPPPVAPPPATESSAWKRPLVIGGFAVAGVGIVAGSITGLLAMSKASSAKKGCVDNQCPPETHSDIDSGKSMATISTISFAVGVVGAGVGVFGLLTAKPGEGPPAGESGKAKISPWIGLGSAGVAGRF